MAAYFCCAAVRGSCSQLPQCTASSFLTVTLNRCQARPAQQLCLLTHLLGPACHSLCSVWAAGQAAVTKVALLKRAVSVDALGSECSGHTQLCVVAPQQADVIEQLCSSPARLHFWGSVWLPGPQRRALACSDRHTMPLHCRAKSRSSFSASPWLPTPAFSRFCSTMALMTGQSVECLHSNLDTVAAARTTRAAAARHSSLCQRAGTLSARPYTKQMQTQYAATPHTSNRQLHCPPCSQGAPGGRA